MNARGDSREDSSLVRDVPAATVAAHELKAPLALIRQLGYELGREDATYAERRELTEQIIRVSEKALRVTSNITRADTLSRTLFELEPVNSIDVARDACRELKPLYELHSRRLTIGRMQKLPPVIANRDLLRRILVNFADNALHYSGAEGVVELQAQLSRSQDVVRLAVRDYGPAMTKRQWSRLVESLHGRQPVHARPQSSGLGIYISDQFAKNMNASIGAIRHRDGASFYVELPVSRQLTLL